LCVRVRVRDVVAGVPAYGATRGEHVTAADAELGEGRVADQDLAEPVVQGGSELETGLRGVLAGDVVDRRLRWHDEVEGARGAVHGERDGAVRDPPARPTCRHHVTTSLPSRTSPLPIRWALRRVVPRIRGTPIIKGSKLGRRGVQ
jgi:hypothetical protein